MLNLGPGGGCRTGRVRGYGGNLRMANCDDWHVEVHDGFGELEEVRYNLGCGVDHSVVGSRLVQGFNVTKLNRKLLWID